MTRQSVLLRFVSRPRATLGWTVRRAAAARKRRPPSSSGGRPRREAEGDDDGDMQAFERPQWAESGRA
jgi:hypothetical protein